MTDQEIIRLLFERSEAALDELNKRYAHFYRQIIRRTLKSEADAAECENDLLLAVWNSIPPQQPENLGAYIASIARRQAADKVRRALREKRAENLTVLLSELEDCLPSPDDPERESESGEIRRAVDDFLEALDKPDRVLFVRRYWFLEEVSELAKRYSMKENAVSVSLYRSRKKLKKLLKERGIDL